MGIGLNLHRIVESSAKYLKEYFAVITLEKAAFMTCFALGTIFLFIALFGPWRYYFLAVLSYLAAFISTEEREH